MASIHDKLDRVRKPRVHIRYDVETEGAMVEKELPMVVGVMSDLSGNAPGKELRAVKDRRFVQIDRDNFDSIMASMTPGLTFKAENTMSGKDEEMQVDLKFNSMSDFEPAQIVEQVTPLKNLMETRNKLRDLLTKVDRSEELEALLEKVLKNDGDLDKLKNELGIGDDGAPKKESEE